MLGYMQNQTRFLPIPVAARSKAWVSGRSLAGIVVSNPGGGMDICVVCCQVEVSVSGWSLVQKNPTSVACMIVNVKPRLWVGLGPMGGAEPWKKKPNSYQFLFCVTPDYSLRYSALLRSTNFPGRSHFQIFFFFLLHDRRLLTIVQYNWQNPLLCFHFCCLWKRNWMFPIHISKHVLYCQKNYVVGKAKHFKENTLHATHWRHFSNAQSTRTESTPAKRWGGWAGWGMLRFYLKTYCITWQCLTFRSSYAYNKLSNVPLSFLYCSEEYSWCLALSGHISGHTVIVSARTMKGRL